MTTIPLCHRARGRMFRRDQLRRWPCARRAAVALLACALPLCLLVSGLASTAAAQFNGRFEIEPFALEQENFLDFLAYSHTRRWVYDWYTVANGINATVGSLSASRFYHQREIRFEQDLADVATFTYRQEEESLFRFGGIYQEVAFRLGGDFNVAAVGFPPHDKTEVNAGLAVGYGDHTQWNYLRYTYLRQSVAFNGQTETDQSFGTYPALHRLEARGFWSRRLFVQARVRVEPRTDLRQPESGTLRTYEGRKYDLVLDWHGDGGDWLAGVQLDYNEERRERLPLTRTSAVPRLTQDLDWGSASVYVSHTLANGDEVEGGLFYAVLDNEIRATDPLEQFDFRLDSDIAYVRWVHRVTPVRAWQFSLLGGDVRREATWILEGQRAHKIEPSFQSKLGTGVLLMQPGRYRFLFQATWNVDAFPGDPWDGGNVQIQSRF